MCSRYFIDSEILYTLERNDTSNTYKDIFQEGDIHPADTAPVLADRIAIGGAMTSLQKGKQDGLRFQNPEVREMKWGFPSAQSNQLMINARAETVLEKRSFSESVLHRRCAIPARQFYEWDQNKNKFIFNCLPNIEKTTNVLKSTDDISGQESIMYMAGFYQLFDDGEHFVIITTQANETMSQIHDRMPLLLTEDEMKDWIYDDNKIRILLKNKLLKLECKMENKKEVLKSKEYKQLSLFEFI